MDLTREQRIARHKDFLKANGELIASFSWEHFMAEGRGIVVVTEEDFIHSTSPELKALRFAYTPKDGDLMQKISKHFEKQEWGWIESYDPNERVIVIVLCEGEETSGYLFGVLFPCSEASTRQLANGN